MSLLRTVLRVVLAIVAWWMAVYPALAVFGALVLPPDPFTQIFVFGVGSVVALIGAVVFVHRSGSLRRLVRFAIAVLLVTFVVVTPVGVLSRMFGGFGFVPALITAIILIVVSYRAGYYLIYENGYERAKARYTGCGTYD